MHSNLKKGLFLVTFLGMTVSPGISVMAADGDTAEAAKMPGVGIEAVLKDFYSQNREIKAEDYLVPENKGEYLDMAFANVTSFLYVRSEPTKEVNMSEVVSGIRGEDHRSCGRMDGSRVGRCHWICKNRIYTDRSRGADVCGESGNGSAAGRKRRSRSIYLCSVQKIRRSADDAGSPGECTADGDYRGFRTAGVKWTGDRRLCMPVYWESVCLGRHKSDRWGRLFRICTVCICTFWNQSSTDNV